MPVTDAWRGDAVELTRELVRVDSRNPSVAAGGPGEHAVARTLASVLSAWGFRVALQEALPGRPNVIARIGENREGAPRLMFNGHVDVVGVDGMIHDPWNAPERDGRIYGRGSSDMKAGVASMCAAAFRAASTGIKSEIVVTAVIDEEWESAGTRALVDSGLRADAAIVTEPTGLAIMPAHRGFVWLDVTTHGRASHGSRWDLGVDAIRHAGLFLAELDAFDGTVLPTRQHPLLGRPSVHASLIEGGTGISTYPDRCRVQIERRTIPGERVETVREEIDALCGRVRERRPNFNADVRVTFAQPASDVAVDAPIVRALSGALQSEDESVRIAGMSAWTDAALLNEAGIPAICFGPGDMGLAHANEEWVNTDEIERATRVLARLAQTWSGVRSA